MTRVVPFTAFVAALVLCFGLGLTQAGQSRAAQPPTTPPPARPGFAAEERPDVQVLLSSIDMTVSLIDAYGRCRDDDKGHERCMTIIRNTLEQARSMIRQ